MKVKEIFFFLHNLQYHTPGRFCHNDHRLYFLRINGCIFFTVMLKIEPFVFIFCHFFYLTLVLFMLIF